jgi:hypothetical protein
MDKARLSRLILSVVALVCWIIGAPVAQAHYGPPRMQLSAERIMPGVELEIRGVNIAPEQPVMLTLVGDTAEYSFGAVMGDEHGDFLQIVSIPRDTQAGAYVVRAFGPSRLILASPLTVVGTPYEEEATQRGQDEPLLAPMPQTQPAIQPSVPAPATAQESQLSFWLAVALAAIAAIAALVIGMRRWARSSNMPFHGDTPAQ